MAGSFALTRERIIARFLEQAGWSAARRHPLAGDASFRRYERLELGDVQTVLMDAPGFGPSPGRADEAAYMQKAALATTIAPFVALADWLRSLGLGTPGIISCDIGAGLMLLEDLGDLNFGHMVDSGHTDLEEAYGEAVHALVRLHRAGSPDRLPVRGGAEYHPPCYGLDIMLSELQMLFDWYAPEYGPAPITPDEEESFWRAWRPLLDTQMEGLRPALLLRDFHTPNLHWRPEKQGPARLGIIDFQDALTGSPAHDLMSLLQDGRKDLPSGFEAQFMSDYLTHRKTEPGFDATAFERSYAILGTLRNIRLLGLWVRLPKRDGKLHYAQHLPLAWQHVERNLAHPDLAEVKDWMDRVFPASSRPGRERI